MGEVGGEGEQWHGEVVAGKQTRHLMLISLGPSV